jgi:hypothetical protein
MVFYECVIASKNTTRKSIELIQSKKNEKQAGEILLPCPALPCPALSTACLLATVDLTLSVG